LTSLLGSRIFASGLCSLPLAPILVWWMHLDTGFDFQPFRQSVSNAST